MKGKLAELGRKYKHGWVFSYFIFYMICFHILEKRVTTYHIIYSPIDGHIPFIEAFIVPYLLWFPYIAAVVLYLFFTNKNDFYQSCIFLFSGMTIFLIVSAVYPNGDLLRPSTFPRNNIFTSLVKMVYAADTPTNILPSIHVFNSIGVYIAIARNEVLGANKRIRYSALVLSILIILSTVFVKQHSVIDVVSGCVMACVLYFVVYNREMLTVESGQLEKRKANL